MEVETIEKISRMGMFIAGMVVHKIFDTNWWGILFTIVILLLITYLEIKFNKRSKK